MSSGPDNIQVIWADADASALHSEVCAILLLLMSADASLEAHSADDDCINILKTCISRIQKRYPLADRELDEGIIWSEASIGAILRLLDYVKGEIWDKLSDSQCVEDLVVCIDRLSIPIELTDDHAW